MLEPITKKRLSQTAVESIKSYVSERKLGPGEKLPTERELSKALGISRTSVREALRMLEIAGLIIVKPGSGIYFQGWVDDLSLPFGVWLPLNEETLHENYEVRQLVEPRTAYLAAERITPEFLEKLQKYKDEFCHCFNEHNLVGMILADTEFHRIIAQAAQNKTLYLIMNTMTRYLTEGWKASLRVPQRPEKTITEHQAIFDAIKNQNPDKASKLMAAHLSKALEEIGSYDQNED